MKKSTTEQAARWQSSTRKFREQPDTQRLHLSFSLRYFNAQNARKVVSNFLGAVK
jgi:hypothetical protein